MADRMHLLDPAPVLGLIDGWHLVVLAVVVNGGSWTVRVAGVATRSGELEPFDFENFGVSADAAVSDDLGNDYTETGSQWGGGPDQIEGRWEFAPALASDATTLTLSVRGAGDATRSSAWLALT
jgi:hypothetical protein